MSLINNALKKAQREREGNRPDRSKLPMTGPRPGNPANSTGFKFMRWTVAGILLVAGFGAALAFMFTLVQKSDPVPVAQEDPHEIEVSIRTTPRPEAVPPPTPAIAAAPTPAIATAEPTPPSAPILPTEEATPSPVAQATESSPVAVTEPAPDPDPIPSPDKESTTTEVSTGTIAETKPEATAPLRTIAEQPVSTSDPKAGSNPAIIRFLEDAKVTGIKVAGVHSRVLMNNQVFRVGSVVEPTTQLTITDILENEIHFTDESGLQYRKQF